MKYLLIALLILTSCSKAETTSPALHANGRAAAADGIDRGNGTDYISFDDRGAWFNGENRVFKYCIEIEPNFGATREQAQDAVADAIATWKAYAADRADNSTITFNGVLSPTCDHVDLTVFFGRSFERVRKVAGPHGLGGAVREVSGREEAWASGFIWITPENSIFEPGDGWAPKPGQKLPDWSLPGHLKAVVRHEFGHVFGTEHIEGTIMDENLALDLFIKLSPEARLPVIDGERQLLRHVTEYEGFLGLPTQVAENFEILFGRAPSGKVHAVMGPNLILTVTDSLGRYQLATSDIEGGYAGGELKMVFEARAPLSAPKNGAGWIHGAFVQLSTIATSTGAKFQGTVEDNMSSYLEQDEASGEWKRASGYVIKIILPDQTARVIFASYVR